MESQDSTFGALLIGCTVGVYLFGINTSQTWAYLRAYPNDRWQMKTFIIVMWLLNFLDTILTSWMVYGSLITNFGVIGIAQDLNFIVYINDLLSVSITSLVQLFFAYRLLKISNFVFIPFIATTFYLARLLCYTGADIHYLLHGAQTKAWDLSLCSVGILTITSDILVGGGLSYSLWRRRILWKAHSDIVSWWPRMIDDLIIISLVADGFLCIVSTITLIMLNISRNYTCMALSIVTCRLFSVSCLASMIYCRNLSKERGDTASLVLFLGSTTIPPD